MSMFFHRLFRPWQSRQPGAEPATHPTGNTAQDAARDAPSEALNKAINEATRGPATQAAPANPAEPGMADWAPAAEPGPGGHAFAPPPNPLWTHAELNTLLNRLRDDEDKLLASTQAVEQEIGAVLSEYATARAGSSPEVQGRLVRRYQRLKQRRSTLDQLHAEQQQVYRLLDHVEANLLRQDLAGSASHDTVLGVPLARLRETLELSVARSSRRYTELRDTVEGLDSHQRDLVLADQVDAAELRAEMNALTEAEYQHNQAQALGEPEAWALAAGTVPAAAAPLLPAGPVGPVAPPASHWQAPQPPGPAPAFKGSVPGPRS